MNNTCISNMDIETIHEKCFKGGCQYQVIKKVSEDSFARRSQLEKMLNEEKVSCMVLQESVNHLSEVLLESEKQRTHQKAILDKNQRSMEERLQRSSMEERFQQQQKDLMRIEKMERENKKEIQELKKIVSTLVEGNQVLTKETQVLTKEIQVLREENRVLREENQVLKGKLQLVQEDLAQVRLELKSMKWATSMEKLVLFVYEVFARGKGNKTRNEIAHLDQAKGRYFMMSEEKRLKFLKKVREFLETEIMPKVVAEVLLVDDLFSIDIDVLKNYIDTAIDEMSEKKEESEE